MQLLIIGEPVGRGIGKERPVYRGTYRDRPYYCEQFGEEHEVNKSYFWFIEKGREDVGSSLDVLDVVHDLEGAKRLAVAYRCYAEQEFDVVEVTSGNEAPSVGEQFLGYDLSRGFFNSLLWYGMDICYHRMGGWDGQREDLLRLIQPLVCLVEHHFKP